MPSLTYNISANWAALFINGLIGFFLAPFLVHGLGLETYGVWSYIVAVTAQIGLLDLGLRSSILKFVAESKKRDNERLRAVWSTAALCYITVSAIALSLSVVFALSLPKLISLPSDISAVARIVAVLVALDAVIELLSGIFDSSLAGSERYDVIASLTVLRYAIYASGTFASIKYGLGLPGIVCAMLAGRVVQRILSYVYIKRTFPEFSLNLGEYNKVTRQELINYSSWAFVVTLSMKIIYSVDVVVAGTVLGATAAALYAIPLWIIEQLRSLAQSGTTTLTPRFAAISSGNRSGDIQRLFFEFIWWSQALIIGVVVPLLISADQLIYLWFGKNFNEAAAILRILSTPFLLIIPSLAILSLYFASAKHREAALILTVEAACNLLLSIYLAYLIGVVGIALGTFIPAIVIRGCYLPIRGCKAFELPMEKFLRTSINGHLLRGIIYAVILIAANSVFVNGGFPLFLAYHAIAFIIFGLSYSPQRIIHGRTRY